MAEGTSGGLEDALFIALARKVGYPSTEEIRRFQKMQADRARDGKTWTLFGLMSAMGGLTPEQEKRFERWSEQLLRKDAGAITESSILPAVPAELARFARVVHDNASSLAPTCPTCFTELDDLALMEGRARLEGARRVCTACAPTGAPTAAAPPAPAAPVAAAAAPDLATDGKDKLRRSSARLAVRSSARHRALTMSGESARVRGAEPGGAVAKVVVPLVLACVALAVAVSVTSPPPPSEKPEAPAPGPVASPPPGPRPPAPVSAPPPLEAPREQPDADTARPQPSVAERAARAMVEAYRLEQEGREPSAIAAIEAALLQVASSAEKRMLGDVRDQMLARLRERIRAECRDIEAYAVAGRLREANDIVEELTPHLPASLYGELDEAVARINEKLTAQAASKSGAAAPAAPKPGGKRPADTGVARARADVDRALAALEVEAATHALDEAATRDPSLFTALDPERARVRAVERLLDAAVAGLAAQKSRAVSLELRQGPPCSGELRAATRGGITLRIERGGERELTLGELSTKELIRLASAAKRDAAAVAAGSEVLLACRSDEPARATPAPAPAPAPAGLTVVRRGAKSSGTPTEPSSSGASKPAEIGGSWLDDTSGAVAWADARTIETDHYIVKTNIQDRYAQRYAKFLEALAERYTQVFEFTGNDFKFKKSEVDIYATYDEFLEREQKSQYLGFYETLSRRLVTFHGPWRGQSGLTLSVLAHEATHQFQHLIVRKWGNAPIFWTEGLASFFEATEIRENGDVVVGKIPLHRMRSLQRAIRDGTTLRLREVIRTPQSDFSALHYDHAWGIIHWLMYGPESKRSQKLLDWYWQRCVERPMRASDFEEALGQLGYTIDKLESSWKEWVAGLDPEKDPAEILYQKVRGKRR